MTSRPGESEQDFRARIVQAARELRDAETEKLRQKYETKFSTLRNQIFKAEQVVDREQEQMKQQKTQTAISLGATVLGAFLGGGLGSSIGRMTTTARGAGRARKEGQDIERAQESLEALKKRMAQLEADFQADVDRITTASDPAAASLERVTLRPTKQNISVRLAALAWLPYWQKEEGSDVRAAY